MTRRFHRRSAQVVITYRLLSATIDQCLFIVSQFIDKRGTGGVHNNTY